MLSTKLVSKVILADNCGELACGMKYIVFLSAEGLAENGLGV